MQGDDAAVEQFLREHAAKLTASHAGAPSQRVNAVDHDYLGLKGQIVFGAVFGQPVDFAMRKGGDGGIDFRIPIMTTVDVKTTTKRDLLVPVSKVHADYYTLLRAVEGRYWPQLIGWATAEEVRMAPTADINGQQCFVLSGECDHKGPIALRAIDELKQKVMRLRV